ncbi:MAG: hypothetical protein RR645_05990, partial [Clostridium sp.]
MSDGSSIHMEAGSKLYLGSTEYIGSNTGADFQIKCTPALIGEVGNQFYHNGAGVTLRQMDNVTSLCFSGQVSTNETFDASEIAKTTNVQYIPYNDYYKCDLSGVWTKSDKSKVVSPNEIAKYITWDNNAITRVQIGSSNNNPYQLMQINYNRLQEVNSSKLTITGVGNVDGKFNKQFHTTPGSKIQSNDAMFQWSYRDLSTLESDGSNLDELERTNDTLLPVGTKIRIDIEVEKNGVPYTISNEYTITDEDVKNATYDQTPPKIIDYSTNSSSFVDNKFTEGDTITLYTNEKLDTNSVPIQSSLDTTIGTGIVTATIEGNRVEIVINKGKEIAAKNSITLRAGSIKDISNNSMGEYILELRDEYKNASSDIRTIFSSRKESKFNCDFNWFSVNGIGSNEVETPYYSDGTYLRFKVETEEENTYKQKTFNDVFEDMTLQTENGAVDSIKGLEPGRQYEDWNGVQTKDYTKFQPEGGKYVFYGVSQSTEGVTKTLGFEKGKERIVKGVFTLKTGINCNVRIIAEVMQQGNDTILSSEKINIYKN